MKKVVIFLSLLIPSVLSGQQFPFMEGYNINTFSLSPAYAGIHNAKTLFLDYRSDWTGIDGGPITYQLSYNDRVKDRIGLGARFIYDKTDIFKQTLLLGTYTYEIKTARRHFINLGLSVGFYRNSVDLTKYYNDPGYVQDMVLINGLAESKIKFASDFSGLYRYKKIETGIYFSNLMFGTVKYRDNDMSYKPFKNYLLHASYLFTLDKNWTVKPTFIVRGGQNIPVQLELGTNLTWDDRLWGTVLVRSPGIFGLGFGMKLFDGIILNYSHNISTGDLLYTFGSNQLTLGIKFNTLMKKGR